MQIVISIVLAVILVNSCETTVPIKELEACVERYDAMVDQCNRVFGEVMDCYEELDFCERLQETSLQF